MTDPAEHPEIPDNSSPTPRQRRGEPVVERVLLVTLEELARQGYNRLSVPEVAAKAGVHKTSVYRRWPTKASLVTAALERTFGNEQSPADTGALLPDMVAMAETAARWADSPVGRGVVRTLLADGESAEVREVVGNLLATQAPAPMVVFSRAQTRGELPETADVPMALTIIAGAITHRLFVEMQPITPEFLERLVRLVCTGLGVVTRAAPTNGQT